MLTEDCKKFLTEVVLKECWHVQRPKKFSIGYWKYSPYCSKCGSQVYNSRGEPDCFYRTFNNITDLHALYSTVEGDGEWYTFCLYACAGSNADVWLYTPDDQEHWYNFAAWLYCNNGKPEDFEAQAQIVAEYYGWEATDLPESQGERESRDNVLYLTGNSCRDERRDV